MSSAMTTSTHNQAGVPLPGGVPVPPPNSSAGASVTAGSSSPQQPPAVVTDTITTRDRDLDSSSSQAESSSDRLAPLARFPSNRSGHSSNDNHSPSLSPSPSPRRLPLSSHEYIQAICAHSRRSALTSNFPGSNYISLANWLLPHTPSSRPPNESREPAVDDRHCLAVLHHLDGHEPDRTRLLAQHDVAALAALLGPTGAARKGNLLFLRGFLPPSWIAQLGSRYRIDPEFFVRHLDFLSPATYRNSFGSPSLATTDNNIIHVYVSTVLSNDSAYPPAKSGFAVRRKEIRDQLVKYKRQLPRSAKYGDSIVREYTVLSPHYAVIEQRISICASPDGQGWVGLVWMDNGRGLEASPPGPWISDFELNSHSSGKAVLPIIQHHQKMAFRKIGDVEVNNVLGKIATTSSDGPPLVMLPQSSLVLPLEYPSLLSAVGLARRASSDVHHALIPIFAHAAFSEVAVLNLLSELIEELIAPLSIDDFRSDCFERLQEYKFILERHADQLRHSLRAIRASKEAAVPKRPHYSATQSHNDVNPRLRVVRSESQWENKDSPPPTLEAQLPEASTYTAAGILENYENLLERCTRLHSRTAAAMSTEMNRASILESRRAIEQSERLKKLTLLATYFIPLTFTASIFGMNFETFGQGHLQLWWYVVIAAPLTLLTYVGSKADVPAWKRRVAAFFESKQFPWRRQQQGILST